MNAEYQRLEAEARDVDEQMQQLTQNAKLLSAGEHACFEQKLLELNRKRAALQHGMALLKAVESPELKEREKRIHPGPAQAVSFAGDAAQKDPVGRRGDGDAAAHVLPPLPAAERLAAGASGTVSDADIAGDLRRLHAGCHVHIAKQGGHERMPKERSACPRC